MAILVKDLYPKVTQEDLREVFQEYGYVKRVHIPVDRDLGRPRDFAFVEMSTDEEEEAAIKALDGVDWRGRQLKVEKARPTGSR